MLICGIDPCMHIINWFRLSSRYLWSIGKFLGLCCLCCLLIVSCSHRPASGPITSTLAGGNDRLSVGTTLKPRTLDPADAYEVADSNIMNSLGDRLYTYKIGTDELQPQLATQLPKVSQDGLTYTIPVRQGVIFHDGTAFNAEAMAFSLNRFIKNGGKPSALLSDIVESVKATGKYEITIKLKNSFAAFPSLLAFSGMCAVSPKAYEIGTGKFKPREFVGTGPYKLAQFTPDQLIRLDVFEKYWGKKPANKGIDFQILSSPANLFNYFRTKRVDIAYQTFAPEQVNSLKQQAATNGWQVIEEPSNVVSYLMLNVRSEPLNNPIVRQAIAAMIDRPLLTERIYKKQASPLYSMIPDTLDSHKPIFQTAYGDGNVTKAKELLTQAKYTKDNPLKLEVVYPTSSPTRAQIASTLREYAVETLEGIVQIQPQTEESATLFANIGKGIYQTVLLDWYPDFGDADNYIQPFFSCTKGTVTNGCDEGASRSQGSFYYSDRMNQLISQERKEQNPKARSSIFAQIQDLLAKDVPVVPIAQTKDYAFAHKGIKGLQIDPILKLPLWDVSKS